MPFLVLSQNKVAYQVLFLCEVKNRRVMCAVCLYEACVSEMESRWFCGDVLENSLGRPEVT